jgi:hypothetical protein
MGVKRTFAEMASRVCVAFSSVAVTDSSALKAKSRDLEDAFLDRIMPTIMRAKVEREPTSTLSSFVKHDERRSWNVCWLRVLSAGSGTLLVFALGLGTK